MAGEETRHIIKQGDCLSSIAVGYGFFWQTIWDYGANSELKTLRKDPNILFPGDVVIIPPLNLGDYSGATEKLHSFVKKGEPTKLTLRFLEDGEPRANEKYVLKIDGRFTNGELDGGGWLKTEIPPKASRVEITFEDEEPIFLKLGTVDPITEVSGVQGRLNNLGFQAGPIDNKFGPRTLAALQRFRQKHNLELTDKIDQPTGDKLVAEHGC